MQFMNTKCLVIKNQDFSHKGYKRFGSEWGVLIKHMLEYLRAPSFPELMVIGNTEKKDEDDAIEMVLQFGIVMVQA